MAQKRKIKSLDRGFVLLDVLRRQGPSRIHEIATELDLSPATIHTYLTTLKDHGIVQQDGVKYKLGLWCIPLGEHVRINSALYRAAKEEMDKLAHGTGGIAHLATEYNGKLLLIHEVFGEEAIGKDHHIRKRDSAQSHLHCTATGKAILAHMPEERMREVQQKHGFPEFTSNTITDFDELLDDLKHIRERGFSINDEEQMKGIRAVGAPILRDDTGEVLGALSVSGPARQWKIEKFQEDYSRRVTRASNVAEINIHSLDE